MRHKGPVWRSPGALFWLDAVAHGGAIQEGETVIDQGA